MENRTDLALESYESSDKTKLNGVIVKENDRFTVVEVVNSTGAKALSKPVGKYITCTLPSLVNDTDMFDGRLDKSADLLRTLLPENASSVLVAGIGNLSITADALGPKSNDYVLATRHILKDASMKGLGSLFNVSSVTTGVLGNTGIESAEIVRGVAERIKPSCVIAIDALAAS